jgi:hypothetical protein
MPIATGEIDDGPCRDGRPTLPKGGARGPYKKENLN